MSGEKNYILNQLKSRERERERGRETKESDPFVKSLSHPYSLVTRIGDWDAVYS